MANEKRLTDVNELVRKVNKLEIFYFTGETDIAVHDCQMVELGAVLAEIDEAPTVDAVEVVRCKDCKHFVQGEPYDPCECMKWKVKFGVAYTELDGYCHKGERKDNG